MEAVLTEKSVKLIAVMLSEPKIKAAVYEKLDHTEKYKIYTINDDGSITLGSTRFHFWNKKSAVSKPYHLRASLLRYGMH